MLRADTRRVLNTLLNRPSDAAPGEPWLVPTPRRNWLVLAAFLLTFAAFVLGALAVGRIFRPRAGLEVIVANTLLHVSTIGAGALLVNHFTRTFDLKTSGLWPVRINWPWIAVAVAALAVLFPLRLLLGYASAMLFEGGLDSINARSNALMGDLTFTWAGALISVIGIGIVAPLGEELLFRGGVFGFLRSHLGLWPSALISSVLFGLAHFDSAGVAAASMLLGLVAAFAYERSRTLWTPILLHVINNTGAALLLQLALALRPLIAP